MGKNISFLFLCFCLLMCGNISRGFGEEITIDLSTLSCSELQNTYENTIRGEIIKGDVTHEKCQQIYNKFNITAISDYYKIFNNDIRNDKNKTCVVQDINSEDYNRHVYYDMWEDDVFCKFEKFLVSDDVNKCQNGNGTTCADAITNINTHITDINTRITNRNKYIKEPYKECTLCSTKLQKAKCKLAELNIIQNKFSLGNPCGKEGLQQKCQELIVIIEGNDGNSGYLKDLRDNNCEITSTIENDLASYKDTVPCPFIESEFNNQFQNSACINATIDNLENILKCRQFIESSYKKYLSQYEANSCSAEYKCNLFVKEFVVLVNGYYSLCGQGANSSNGRNVLGNCSEAVFDLEQFYLKVKNLPYVCEYKTDGSNGGSPISKNVATETLKLIKKYNEYVDELINTGTGGIKSNGIARGICYAINIVSGPFGRAIASLFVILLGMSFLSGHSESLSFKSLISIAFALALIFGSERLANIISRNVYSCKHIIVDK